MLAAVIVASTSAAAGQNADRTGPVIAQWLRERGFEVTGPQIVADGRPVGVALREAIAAGVNVIVTTGGTGVSPSDLTPEETAPLLDVELPGVIECIRQRGSTSTPLAALTRGVAGFAGECFIANLPGSRGGVADGLAVLDGVLLHALAQRLGGGAHEDAGSR